MAEYRISLAKGWAFRTRSYARNRGFAAVPRSCGNVHRRSPLPAKARRAMSRTLFFLPELVGRDAAPASAKESTPSMARRPVIFDVSHLIARLRARTGTGIDRIDLAYALHFFAEGGASEAVRYGSGPPRLISVKWALRFTRAARGFWTDDASARAEALWTWLESPPSRATKPKLAAPSRNSSSAWGRRLLSWTGYLIGSALRAVPARAIYLNVGYHRFEQPRFFAWLAKRPDVDGVFMIHDLLPLDYPEYFEDGETEKFRARIDTALRYGRAFLVSTEVVRRRLQQEMGARGFEQRPIWAQPFPSPLAAFTPSLAANRRPAHPYFVVIGTIELGGLIASQLNLSGPMWHWFEHIDINMLGFVIVGLFILTWAAALTIWRVARIEERWTARRMAEDYLRLYRRLGA